MNESQKATENAGISPWYFHRGKYFEALHEIFCELCEWQLIPLCLILPKVSGHN